MNHTRAGSTAGSIVPKGTKKAVKLKQVVLQRSIERVTVGASASTMGSVVGDLNLTYQQVQYVLETAARHRQNLCMCGGKGASAA